MKRKYREYTDDDIIRYAKEVFSIAGLLRKLGLKQSGGNYSQLKKNLQKLDIDCSHWTGAAWSKDKQLKDWSEYTKIKSFKKHIIRDRGNQCENCLNFKWLDLDIPLEVHHLDGDKTNNCLDNLQLLCPNCHALTNNWRGRNQYKTNPPTK